MLCTTILFFYLIVIFIYNLPNDYIYIKNKRYCSSTNLYDNRYSATFIIYYSKRDTSQIALTNVSAVGYRVILHDIMLTI